MKSCLKYNILSTKQVLIEDCCRKGSISPSFVRIS